MLESTFYSLLVAFNSTCRETGLCNWDVDEETSSGIRNMESNDPLPPLKASGMMHFGEHFTGNRNFLNYATACTNGGGTLQCVDSRTILLGEGGAAFNEGGNGVEVDADVEIYSFPLCVPQECAGHTLDKLFENAAKRMLLNAPFIRNSVSAQNAVLFQSATFQQVCLLSGLDTCKLNVEPVSCEIDEITG